MVLHRQERLTSLLLSDWRAIDIALKIDLVRHGPYLVMRTYPPDDSLLN